MPNLLVDGVAEALRKSKAVKIYICNVMTQPGETDGYTASMHAKAIIDHGGKGIIDYMLVNDSPISPEMQDYYAAKGAYPVEVDEDAINALTGLCQSTDKETKLAAIKALANCGGTYSVTQISNDFIKEKDPDLKQAMSETLDTIRKRLKAAE